MTLMNNTPMTIAIRYKTYIDSAAPIAIKPARRPRDLIK